MYGDIHCTHFYCTHSINVALLPLCYLVIYLPHSSGRFRRQDEDEWSAKMAASLKKSLKITFSNRKRFAEVFLVMSAFNLRSKIFKVVDTNFYWRPDSDAVTLTTETRVTGNEARRTTGSRNFIAREVWEQGTKASVLVFPAIFCDYTIGCVCNM